MSIERQCIPTYMFNLIVRVFDDKGLDSAGLVDGTHFKLSDLADLDTRMSYRDALRIIRNAYRISGDEGLGLAIAKQINIADWGLMGYAVASCGSLKESLIVGQRYNRTATRLTDNTVHSDGTLFGFQSTPLYEAGAEERFLVEEDLGGVIGMVHRYLDQKAAPREVHFTYPAPNYLHHYEEHFRCPLKFEQPRNQIVWHRVDIERPHPLRNPVATQLAIRQCEQLLADDVSRGDMVDKVRSHLAQTPGEYPPINAVAAAFNMSESSLRRALRAVGSSYQEILNDVRKKLAIEYLTTSSLTLENIAHLVGYSDLSNFRRAFRSWTGKPPLEYRARK
ncbi:AraC family transcriptional regulator [Exilibacterium tricleocarpae]|uniref:AraC family transcriptional regulator n=1 Tax=Exilibacterium tricleocarpae TaxID=2591008 RepID=A0A545SQG4_9GAMM|nr:AraC family transcriptional regulator [Exilibacterium tricleocarpae]TQV67230.1 AraC family transcriptional regulator [Exilibacterium tricleocarpae]